MPVCSVTLIQKIANEIGSVGIYKEEQLLKEDVIEVDKKSEKKQNDVFSVLMDGGRCKVWQNPKKLGDSQWKEVKLGGFCKYNGKNDEKKYKLESKQYIGRVDESSQIFGERLYHEAINRGYLHAKKKLFISDGAKGNWEVQQTYFYDAVAILDWYHATEHLSEIGKIVYGENSERYYNWFEKTKNILYGGEWLKIEKEINRCIKLCKSKTKKLLIKKQRNYFYFNRERIKYREFEENGYTISSAIIESGIKMIVNKRIKGTEKHWRKHRANNILKLKIDELNDNMHNLCQLYKNAA